MAQVKIIDCKRYNAVKMSVHTSNEFIQLLAQLDVLGVVDFF